MSLILSGSDGLSDVDGTAATPAIRGTDTNTGIFFPAADTIAFSEGGTEAMRIDSAGNLGVGTTSPSRRLEITGSTDTNSFLQVNSSLTATQSIFGVTSTNVGFLGTITNNDFTFRTNNTERMRIDSSGNLLVGTTSNVGVGALVALRGGGNVLHVQSNSAGANNIVSYDSGGAARFSVSNGGAVSKTSGSFKIDHPLLEKSETHHLVHSFVEAPQADNIYRGKVVLINGKAEVNIDLNSGMTDGTFVALNREVQCFTSNETDWDAVCGAVVGNILTIECQNTSSTATISWLVIGERQDKHMYETDWTDENGKVIVEPLKELKTELDSVKAELATLKA